MIKGRPKCLYQKEAVFLLVSRDLWNSLENMQRENWSDNDLAIGHCQTKFLSSTL